MGFFFIRGSGAAYGAAARRFIRLGRQHVRDGFLTVHQDKTGAAVTLPIHHELKAILVGSAIDHLTFLTTATGKPFAPGAITNWFGCAVRQAGLPLGLSAHGLRKAMCRRLAEAGCSTKQIQAISCHATLKEVDLYTKAAEQKRLAAAAMSTINEQNWLTGQSGSPKSSGKVLKVKGKK